MSKTVLAHLLNPEEKECLEAIYLSKEVATDQLRRTPDVLAEILDGFHAATSRTEISSGLLMRYIFNRRKKKDWPRLGLRARKFTPVTELLTPSQTATLRQIYEALDLTSDELLFSAGMMRQIATMFHERTGVAIKGSVLVAFIVAKRKRGAWVKIRTERPFGDIGEVAAG